MPRLLMLVEFSDQATPPEGEPPSLTVHGESTRVVSFEGDAPERAAFDSSVTMTGETAFDERGAMTFGNGQDRIRFSTMGEGYLGPSPEEGLLEGSVIWRVEEGRGPVRGGDGAHHLELRFARRDGPGGREAGDLAVPSVSGSQAPRGAPLNLA
jgi:hypothetical protein